MRLITTRFNKNQALPSFVIASLYIFFICDGINAILRYYQFSFERVSILPRTMFELAAAALMIIHGRIDRKGGLIFVVMISLACVFVLGFGTFLAQKPDVDILENVIFCQKMFFFFICFCFLAYQYKERPALDFTGIFKAYETIVLISGAVMVIGFLFKIECLSSYASSGLHSFERNRFGYKGLIQWVNEATVFWLIALFYGLSKVKFERSWFLFFVSLLCCILLGSKGGLFLSVFVAATFFIVENKKLGSIVLGLFSLLAVAFSGPILQFAQHQFDTNPIFVYFRYRQSTGVDIANLLLSGRTYFVSTLFVDNIRDFWTPLNWLFGGQDRVTHLIEMDLFDTFLFFGIVGTALYFVLYLLAFSSMKKPFRWLFTMSYFLLATLNGHTFWSSMNALYLAIFILKTSEFATRAGNTGGRLVSSLSAAKQGTEGSLSHVAGARIP